MQRVTRSQTRARRDKETSNKKQKQTLKTLAKEAVVMAKYLKKNKKSQKKIKKDISTGERSIKKSRNNNKKKIKKDRKTSGRKTSHKKSNISSDINLSDIPLDLRKIMYDYAKPFPYVFREVDIYKNNSTPCNIEEAFNMFIKSSTAYDSVYKDDNNKYNDVKKMKEFVDTAEFSKIYILDPDDKDIYTDRDTFNKYVVYVEDDFKKLKKQILKGYFWVDVGTFGYTIIAISPVDKTLENNEKLEKLENFLFRNFETVEWDALY